MLIELEEFFKHFVHYCQYGNAHGWHENGTGAVSMIMPDELVLKLQSELDMTGEFQPLGVRVPKLAKEFFITTAKREIWDEIEERPSIFCGIVQISPDGTGYRVVFGLQEGNHVSTDFPIHLRIHEKTLMKTKAKRSIVYHCHPTNLTALTYVLPLEEKVFGEALMKASVHCAMALEHGIGVVERFSTSIEELAEATVEKIDAHNMIIWPFHGVICAGEDLPHLMGQVEIVEKAAAIRMKLLQLPGGTRQEPSMDELERIRNNK